MAAVVFYTSEQNKKFRSDLPALSIPTFALCWSDQQRKLSANALDTTSIYCNISSPSFAHLSGPIIFIEESVDLNLQLLEKLAAQTHAAVLVDQDRKSYNWLEEVPLICSGVCFPSAPASIDTSSYQAFRAWLGQIARNLFQSTNGACLLAVEVKSSSEAKATPSNTSNLISSTPHFDKPEVSVIVPSFDRPLFLERCLKSIQAQTYQNFEVLVISNNEIKSTDSRIKSIITNEKIAVSKARNLGLKNAKGKFVAYLDDDDYYLTNHLEVLVQSLTENNQAMAFSICARQWEVDPSSAALAYDMPFLSGASWPELLVGNKCPTPAVLHINKPEFYFDENLECMEDWDLWLRASKGSEIAFIPKVTCLFSRRPEQSSISSSSKLLFHWYGYAIWNKHLDLNIAEELKSAFRSLLKTHSLQILEKLQATSSTTANLLPKNFEYVSKAISDLHSKNLLPTEITKALLSYLNQKAIKSDENSYDASVIIPLYNGLALTKALWKSIIKTPSSLKLEFIFIDNGSTDGTPEWLESLGQKVHKILNSQNRNFAGASNQGAYAANSNTLIFLNNDTEVTANWAESLISPLHEDNSIGAVGNKQIFPGSSRIHHAGIYIDLSGHPKHYLEGVQENDPRVNFVRECVAVTGGCFAMRKNDFIALGGFYEEYKNGYEDIDLFVALRKLGKRIIYTPKSRIYHHVSKSAGRSTHSESNWRLFIERCGQHLTPDLARFLEQNRQNNC